MKLDALQAVLRRRTVWEATDLGLAMARTWASPLWRAWLTVMTPSVTLIWLVLWQRPLGALVVCWWLKPLWGHAALHVLSRKLFSESPALSETLRETARLAPQDLPGKLLWRRVLPWRTAVAPVLQLEGLSGPEARARRGVLLQTLAAPTALLVAIALMLELVVASGLVGAIFMALPDEPRFAFVTIAEQTIGGEAPLWTRVALPLIAWAVLATVEPLVVAAGFGLYLNRRTELEGWDIELSFRRLADRMARGRRSAAALVTLFVLLLGAAGSATAATPRFSDAAVVEALEQAQEHPNLESTRMARVWRLRTTFDGTLIQTGWETLEDWLERLEDWLFADSSEPEVALPGLAEIAEALLWLVAGVALGGVLLAIVSRGWRVPTPAVRRNSLATVHGVAVLLDPDRPDADPVALAQRHWKRGSPDEALGVLYAAAVYWLVHQQGVPVPEGATEGEVLRLARQSLHSGEAAQFAVITRGWQAAAYAHEVVSCEAFNRACAAWPVLEKAP